MNKQQLQYLTSKIAHAADKAIREYSATRPTRPSDDDVVKALNAAGFIPVSKTHGPADFRYSAGYLTLPPTQEMEQNKIDIMNYGEKVNAARAAAIDQANLGDNADALNILAAFTDALKNV